jgi:hypothetical protein
MFRQRTLAASALLLLLALAPRADAGLLQVGGTFTVAGLNFPTSFSQVVPVSTSPSPVNAGQLSLTTTVFPTGPNGEWADFAFSTTNGGPLAGNINASWNIQFFNLPMTQPSFWDGIYFYWTVNGTAVDPIFPFGSIGVAGPNPVNPALGPVFGNLSFPGVGPDTSITINPFITIRPYSFVSAGGINPNTANGIHLGIHFDAANPTAVPEPSSLALLGVGGLGVMTWVRRKRGAA